MQKFFKNGFLRADSGAAAIESIFILPFMCVLYFGSQDLTSLIVFNKKMNDVATVMSDSVAQYKDTLTRATITDMENSIDMIIPFSQASNVQVDVYGYYSNNGAITKRWSTKSSHGTSCSAPNTSLFTNMMGPGNDIIVAVACMNYTPWVGSFMGGSQLLGSPNFTLTQSVATVPYASKTIKCVTVTGGTTLCSEI